MSVTTLDNVHVAVDTAHGTVAALRGVDLQINQGDRLGLVGESGSGKSMTIRSILGMLPEHARVSQGRLSIMDEPVNPVDDRQMARVRGRHVAVIFQHAREALNPVLPVGRQIADVYLRHRGGTRREAREAAIAMLGRVAFPDPPTKSRAYPHELSGGLCQRVLVAMALVCRPKLLAADEPTTGLDVTIQKQVVDLIVEVIEDLDAALLFVSHDIGIVSGACDRIAVMYAGRIVEHGDAEVVLNRPTHPYTQGLVKSYKGTTRHEMPFIRGTAPDALQVVKGCAFASRCPLVMERCWVVRPDMVSTEASHEVACHAVQQ
jgi:oligopeptide/dipeptide ABC transporter ATP-binding protein